MEKILITGINGFIGSNTAKHLTNLGYEIWGSVRHSSNLYFVEDLSCNLITCDLLHIDPDLFPDDFDIIIHCASLVADYAGEKNAKKNIYAVTKNFTDLVVLKQKKLKKFIYISTSLVLGYNKLNISPDNPGVFLKKNPYVKYKQKNEDYIIQTCLTNHINYTILRPADVYGPYDRTSCLHMIHAIEKNVPVIVSHGNYIFPYCSVILYVRQLKCPSKNRSQQIRSTQLQAVLN